MTAFTIGGDRKRPRSGLSRRMSMAAMSGSGRPPKRPGRETWLTASLGSVLPGAGRVLSIRRTGAGWVVITTETIIGPVAP
ncbi:hypothetical protein [Methylorubrum populi]|uniref:hypothetical protein n=1 Tax=Methylorubrum populi TaxID=223967 RepID=UPI002F35DE1F